MRCRSCGVSTILCESCVVSLKEDIKSDRGRPCLVSQRADARTVPIKDYNDIELKMENLGRQIPLFSSSFRNSLSFILISVRIIRLRCFALNFFQYREAFHANPRRTQRKDEKK